jgi:hypothetical protein
VRRGSLKSNLMTLSRPNTLSRPGALVPFVMRAEDFVFVNAFALVSAAV